MGFSEEATRQPTVYEGLQPAYLQAHCLRGFPDYLPANALLTRACGQPIHRVSRPEYAEAAELTTRVLKCSEAFQLHPGHFPVGRTGCPALRAHRLDGNARD